MDNFKENSFDTTEPQPVRCKGCDLVSDTPMTVFHAENHLLRWELGQHEWQRNDYYGMYTGLYCDKCYNSNDSALYPYKKDGYFDESYAGEQLYNEDNEY